MESAPSTPPAIPELLESNVPTIATNPIIVLLCSQHSVLKVTTCNAVLRNVTLRKVL